MPHIKPTRILAAVLAVLMLIPAASAARYTDLPLTHWAYDNIQRLSSENWFSGYPDGSFRPNGTITRAEAVKVFVTFLNRQVNSVSTSSFYDVDVNKWYAPYIEAGKDLFPASTSTSFRPDMPVNREDTVYALVNALGFGNSLSTADESVLNTFTDRNSISSNIRKHFAVALNNQLVSGYPDNTIRPKYPLTRAEFATLLYRGTVIGIRNTNQNANPVATPDVTQDTTASNIRYAALSPAAPDCMTIGERLTLQAKLYYTDGSTQPYTDLQPYDAGNNGVITVNGPVITAHNVGTATIKFRDTYLRNETVVITVTVPNSVPTIRITSYPGRTENDSVTISGTVSDAVTSVSELTCNGKNIAFSRNLFSTTVSLNDGINNFKFIATNSYGISAEKTITIEKTAATPTQTPVETPTETPSASNGILPLEAAVVELVNQERTAHGLAPVTISEELCSIARLKSKDMANLKYFSHESPTYGSVSKMLRTFGIRYSTYGENIAWGYGSATAVMKGWMNSEGHRKNILNASFKKIGVGFASSGNYWTQLFIG